MSPGRTLARSALAYSMTNTTVPSSTKLKSITRTPPRLPWPARPQRTLRAPSAPGMTSPVSGWVAIQPMNSCLLVFRPDRRCLPLECWGFDHGAHADHPTGAPYPVKRRCALGNTGWEFRSCPREAHTSSPRCDEASHAPTPVGMGEPLTMAAAPHATMEDLAQ